MTATLPADVQPLDTTRFGDVLASHTAYRREFALVPALIRNVRDGDTRRAAVVVAHLEFLERSLRHQKWSENEFLVQKVRPRTTVEYEPLLALMEAQHDLIEATIARIERVRPEWARTADAERGDEIARLYEELLLNVVEHFDAEEDEILPVAAAAVTEKEWKAGAIEAGKRTKKSDIPLLFGMVQYGADPQLVAQMQQYIPGLLRGTVTKLGRNAYAKHALRVHGTEQP